MTAAHCAQGRARNLEVLLGEHDFSSADETTVVRKGVSRIINHGNYNDRTLDYDYALLELDSAIDFAANSHIRPICLPEGSDDYVGQDAVVTGWGTTSAGGSQSNFLREVTVGVLTNSVCSTMNNADITARMICASVPEGGKDSCQGDSGGPMIASGSGSGTTAGENYEQIGVVSWGFGCADARYPGVYSRVTAAISWIESNTSGSFTTCPRT